MVSEKVILAYSGGLDTSVAINWIKKETGKEIVAVAIDLGQGGEDLEEVRKRALACGAAEAIIIDAKDEFADEYCLPVITANALYMGNYPLISAISRPLIAKHLVKVAQQYNGVAIAHGCTGKGNDQVRFEISFNILAPEISVIAPVRDYAWSRDKAIEFAKENNLPINVTTSSPFSIDQNVWGRAVETGFLEDLWNAPTEAVYNYTQAADKVKEPYDELIISFVEGKPTAIDGREVSLLRLIQELNQRAGAQGVGRLDLVEDRLVGIKSREVYEAPAALVLIAAHTELENITLERELHRFKNLVEKKWTDLVYDGLWFSPLKNALDSFINTTQKYVTGDIRVRLQRGNIIINGRRSDFSLYDYNLATYSAEDSFDQSAARGFIQLFGLSAVIAAKQTKKR